MNQPAKPAAGDAPACPADENDFYGTDDFYSRDRFFTDQPLSKKETEE
jgi:hypothetical protein